MTTRYWKTVRIFISSTFRDMHAERDHLAKVVFPELRERCRKRQLHLVDLDLRWGVTEEDAEQGKVVGIILKEIDRSRPFFIAILGERYGSIPDKIPKDTKSVYKWIPKYPEYSLTALEIIHGVLQKPERAKRGFFYFRDPSFISDIPSKLKPDYKVEDAASAEKLSILKEKILCSGRPVMKNYPCRWDKKKAQLVGLDVFGQQVLKDLWSAISQEYPQEEVEADPLIVERQMHETFAEVRSRLYIGRMKQTAQLSKYIRGEGPQPVVITGESGCGKSAFLANWYKQYVRRHPDDFVIAYFIGASPDSTGHWNLLRNICTEIKQRFSLEKEIPEDNKQLSETLRVLLISALQQKKRMIILLDALDQLSDVDGAHELGWLLNYIPKTVHLVTSSLEGVCLEVLRRRQSLEIKLPPLTKDEQRLIIQAVLGEWRRKLNDHQMTVLLSHLGVKNPLYLRIALEELRLFGKYEQLSKRIKNLADDITGLFNQVLERLENDHGYELVSEVFSLLESSRYGLNEVELLDLIAIDNA